MLRAKAVEIQQGRFHLGPLDLQFHPGTLSLIRGPNGSGKSSLLRVLMKRRKPSRGEIHSDARMVGVVGLEPIFIGSWTLKQNAAFLAGLSGTELNPLSAEFQKFSSMRVDDLSAGLKRRLELELMLGLPLDFFFFDEPFNSLDVSGRKQLATRLQELRSAGKTLILTTHTEDELLSPPDQVISLS